MATSVAHWDDLLAGEELAYLGSEAAREARLAPLPEDLHPRVREALAGAGDRPSTPTRRRPGRRRSEASTSW